MKQLLLLTFISFFLFSCKKENATTNETSDAGNEWTFYDLNSNVKSFSDYTTTDSTSTTNVRNFENSFYEDISLKFDSNGKLIEKIIFKEDGSISENQTYDGKDKLLSKRQFTSNNEYIDTKYSWENNKNTLITRRNQDGSLFDKEVFLYNNNLLVEQQKFNNKEVLTNRSTFTYNTKNQLVVEKIFENKEVIQSSFEYDYDNNGNRVSESKLDNNLDVIYRTIYKYQNGLIVEEATYTNGDKLESQIKRTFDFKNRLVVKTIFDSFDNSTDREEFGYDDNDNTISWKVYKNEKLSSQTTYIFDEKNNLINEITLDGNDKITNTKIIDYLYDNKSNWINKRTTINGKTFFTSRKIEYY